MVGISFPSTIDMRQLGLFATIFLIFVVLSSCAPPEGVVVVTPTIPPPTLTPTATATPIFVRYTIRSGDTLWKIAQQYGIDIELLAEVNEIDNVDDLTIGDELLISDYVTISGRILPTPTPTPTPTATPRPCLNGCRKPSPGCEIKGFTSQLDGIQMYVLPSDDLYPVGQADLWFCDPVDAEQAGWKRWTEWGPSGN